MEGDGVIDQESLDNTPAETAIDLFLPEESATEQFGALLIQVIRQLGNGVVLYLTGDLGAGKTTLSRGLIQGAGHAGAVKSPTYTLVEPYEQLLPPIYHFDLYRLGDPEELEFMGIRDYLSNSAVCLVEWPQRGAGILPEADVALDLRPEESGRRVHCKASSQRGRRMLEQTEIALKQSGLAP